MAGDLAAAILNRVKAKGWTAHIPSPTAKATSMNGITIQRQQPLVCACEADAVIIGSGIRTRELVADAALLPQIKLDPSRQLIGAMFRHAGPGQARLDRQTCRPAPTSPPGPG